MIHMACDVFLRYDVRLNSCGNINPHLFAQTPRQKYFGVWIGILGQMHKIFKLCIIRTIVAIGSKFYTVIKPTNYSLWVIP